MEKQVGDAESTAEQIKEYLGPVKLSARLTLYQGAALAIALAGDVTWAVIEAVLKSIIPADQLPGPARQGHEVLYEAIRVLSERQRLVLHVLRPSELNAPLRTTLTNALQFNPRLVLAFSCDAHDSLPEIAVSSVLRFDFVPYSREELRSRVNEQLQPNSFPDALFDAVFRFSRGLPERIALMLGDLIGTRSFPRTLRVVGA